jgi:hypothetical protein
MTFVMRMKVLALFSKKFCSVSVKRYLSSLENWVEMSLIVLTFILLFSSGPEASR